MSGSNRPDEQEFNESEARLSKKMSKMFKAPPSRTLSTLERARSSLGLGLDFFRKSKVTGLSFASREPEAAKEYKIAIRHPWGRDVTNRSREKALPLPGDESESVGVGKFL